VTHTRRQLTALLHQYGLAPSRALGQNFVVDPNTVRRIARLADVGPGDHVLEIGAGLGSLTLALLATGAAVTAVEVDRHVAPVLRQIVEPSGARVIQGDATALEWSSVLSGAPTWTLVANLPYNVATPLVLVLLDKVPQIERMLVMVQREAGERLASGPGSRTYGIPSVKVAYWAEASVVGRVSPEVFLPRPNVESVLVRIVRRSRPATDADADRLFTLVHTAFGQRRKMLRRSLAELITVEQLAAADVSPQSRPEQLSIDDWGRLANASERSR